jgi:hypothetical protein
MFAETIRGNARSHEVPPSFRCQTAEDQSGAIVRADDSSERSDRTPAGDLAVAARLVAVLSMVRARRGNTEFDRQRRDLAAILKRRGVGEVEFERDFLEHEAIGQTAQNGALGRPEMTGQCGEKVMRAYRLEQFTVGVIVVEGSLVLGPIDRHAAVAIGALEGIQASPRRQPVLDVEAAILQIPAPSSAGLFVLESPETEEAFLHEIVLQRPVGGQPGYNPAQRLIDSGVFDQHNTVVSVSLNHGKPRRQSYRAW